MNREVASRLVILTLSVCLQGGACEGDSAFGEGLGEIRVVHLAPAFPDPSDTALDFEILGEGFFGDVAFAEASDNASLDPDLYFLTAAASNGTGDPLASTSFDLDAFAPSTIVAYRDDAQSSALSLATLELGTSLLGEGRGRVLIGHGADDPGWTLVDVVNADTGDVIAEDLVFGGQSASIDVDAGELPLLFEGVPPSMGIDEGPFLVTVEPQEALLLFIIDVDPTADSIDAELYGIGPMTTGTIEPLPRGTP